jgi:hypothetical protein
MRAGNCAKAKRENTAFFAGANLFRIYFSRRFSFELQCLKIVASRAMHGEAFRIRRARSDHDVFSMRQAKGIIGKLKLLILRKLQDTLLDNWGLRD